MARRPHHHVYVIELHPDVLYEPRFRRCNPAFAELMGAPEQALVGLPVQRLFGSVQSWLDFNARVALALAQQQPVRDVWEMQRFDGTPFLARLSGRSVQLAG